MKLDHTEEIKDTINAGITNALEEKISEIETQIRQAKIANAATTSLDALSDKIDHIIGLCQKATAFAEEFHDQVLRIEEEDAEEIDEAKGKGKDKS